MSMQTVIQCAQAQFAVTTEEVAWLSRIGQGAQPSQLDKDAVASLFLKLYQSLTAHDPVSIMTQHLAPLVAEDMELCRSFNNIATEENLQYMLRLLNSQQSFHAALLQVICAIICVGKVEMHPQSVKQVLDYCVNNLRSPTSSGSDYIKGLSFLLRSNEIRDMFAEKAATPLLTERVVGSSTDVQLQYVVGFCLWMLSFSDLTMLQLLENNSVAKLHDILKNYKKEKCCRIAVVTLTNFLKYQDKQETDPSVLPEGYTRRNIYSEMVSLGVLRTLQVLSKRNFADHDVVPMIVALIEKLEQRIEDTSSFGDYKQEVLSGRLEWTPVHKSEKFWKENIKEFEAENFYILKELASILNSSKDSKVQCIALHDFGEFVRHHTQGRKVLTALNVKPRIIQLLEDQNEDVKKEALLCTQKLMVKKWEFLA